MIVVGGRNISAEDFYAVLFKGGHVSLDENALRSVEENFRFLEGFARDKIIYGINTGLGPMSQYKVAESDRLALQYNLIRSHAAGSGDAIPVLYVRAAMLARLNMLMKGFSGIHSDAVFLLRDLLNHRATPVVPSHGGVGASGDLVQLAHIALILIGEGEIDYQGALRPTREVFDELGLQPLRMRIREALALINGTSVMSGIGLVNIIHAYRLLDWAVFASALINEIVESYDDHFSHELNRVKMHPGQAEITNKMLCVLRDSRLVRKRPDHLFNGDSGEMVFSKKIQEYYSLRCVTQVLGPVADTVRNAETVVMNEINSVNDNPIIDHKNHNVYHGGNFHGDYVSLEMDKLKIAITKLSMLAERQHNFLMNDKLNGKLPPFVNLGTLGLNLGMQGAQFTATSTVAENQSLCAPLYIHSIPTNNDNQDIVSMGTNAALAAGRVIGNSFEVMAIQVISLLQAVDHLSIAGQLSTFNRQQYELLRKIVPVFKEDEVIYPKLREMTRYLLENQPNCGV
jgi:histidine ammonia-lyase